MHNIETINLMKEFKGNFVLNNINISLHSGKVYGFVGKNGSGKTMLFRALGGLITPSSGKIIIDNKEMCSNNNELPKIGLVIENASLYPGFTGLKNLMYLARINNYIGEQEVRDAIKHKVT